MKSVSGDDGSYTLTASFELGTNPDINSVNVNNRVQIALSQLPPEVQRRGVTVKKKSSALLGVISIYSPKRPTTRSISRTTSRSTCSTRSRARRASATPRCGGRRTTPLTRLGENGSADRPQPDDRRHHQRHPVAERAGRRRSRRRAADLRRPAASAQYPDQGSPDDDPEFENIVVRTNSDGSILRLKDGAARTRRQNLDRETLFNGAPSAAVAIYQSPGANALIARQDQGDDGEAKSASRDLAWKVTYDPTVSCAKRSTRCRRRWSKPSCWSSSSSTCSSAACGRR